jgi:transcriptional regulator with XRE-family HTH domain
MALAQAVKDSIIAEMKHQRVSQRELARRVGFQQQYLWRRISSNKRAHKEFTPSELELIADALGVPVTTFLPSPVAAITSPA